MKNVTVAKSKRPGKKYKASFEDGHTVHFGAAGMSDFTLNKDPKRRKAYLARQPTKIGQTRNQQVFGHATYYGKKRL